MHRVDKVQRGRGIYGFHQRNTRLCLQISHNAAHQRKDGKRRRHFLQKASRFVLAAGFSSSIFPVCAHIGSSVGAPAHPPRKEVANMAAGENISCIV